mmetsp:Transcript_46782/g.110027  ORF Transcript_46782/g.110027 Transcript_46782/m.110027 type:complete len:269 (-) Transcript_46782:28-834(-)
MRMQLYKHTKVGWKLRDYALYGTTLRQTAPSKEWWVRGAEVAVQASDKHGRYPVRLTMKTDDLWLAASSTTSQLEFVEALEAEGARILRQDGQDAEMQGELYKWTKVKWIKRDFAISGKQLQQMKPSKQWPLQGAKAEVEDGSDWTGVYKIDLLLVNGKKLKIGCGTQRDHFEWIRSIRNCGVRVTGGDVVTNMEKEDLGLESRERGHSGGSAGKPRATRRQAPQKQRQVAGSPPSGTRSAPPAEEDPWYIRWFPFCSCSSKTSPTLD